MDFFPSTIVPRVRVAEISVTFQARPVAVCILDNESIRAVNLELTLASDVATHSQTGKYSQTRYGDFAEIQENTFIGC